MQGVSGLPLAFKAQGNNLRFELTNYFAVYNAVLSPERDKMEGDWLQDGLLLPLTMKKLESILKLRPQIPHPPYPYRSEEVHYYNSESKSRLTGTLTLPVGKGPFAAVLLISGSGLHDRDQTMFHHKPFLIWADYLTRCGLAVLRVDDRQVGGSTGDITNADTTDFACDAKSGVAYLRSRRDIDKSCVGLMGHSEGAIIASMIASCDNAISFIVMLAGPGISGEEILLQQKRAMETIAGFPPEVVDQSVKNVQRLCNAVKDTQDQASADVALSSTWNAIAREQGLNANALPSTLPLLSSPWMRWFIRYDPRPTLEKVHCPVLAITGSKDLQVLADPNLGAIKSALLNNPNACIIKMPLLNHLLQTANTGLVSEYSEIQETVSPSALSAVSDWIFNFINKSGN